MCCPLVFEFSVSIGGFFIGLTLTKVFSTFESPKMSRILVFTCDVIEALRMPIYDVALICM